MKVRKEMTNGFNIAHGGITYSLAAASVFNLETSINHLLQTQMAFSHYQLKHQLII